MQNLVEIFATILIGLACVTGAAHAGPRSEKIPDIVTVLLPSGGSVDIRIDNFENPDKKRGGQTILAVHGLAHTGAAFEPLARELFKKSGRDKVQRVLALNLPGRNGSGLPSRRLFGDLTLEDFTAVLLGVLDRLPRHLRIGSLVGHSMGGLIVQTAQDRLNSWGTSLQKEYGIKNVYLLAPSIPNPLPWLFADSMAGSAIAAALVSFDETLGTYLRVRSSDPKEQADLLAIWLSVFFADRAGQLVAGAPVSTALAKNYLSNEALVAVLQLLGANGFERPFVNREIFGRRTQRCFRLLTFSEDLQVPGENLGEEHQNLGSYLTGDREATHTLSIEAPDAVHDMFIANPAAVAGAIDSCR